MRVETSDVRSGTPGAYGNADAYGNAGAYGHRRIYGPWSERRDAQRRVPVRKASYAPKVGGDGGVGRASVFEEPRQPGS